MPTVPFGSRRPAMPWRLPPWRTCRPSWRRRQQCRYLHHLRPWSWPRTPQHCCLRYRRMHWSRRSRSLLAHHLVPFLRELLLLPRRLYLFSLPAVPWSRPPPGWRRLVEIRRRGVVSRCPAVFWRRPAAHAGRRWNRRRGCHPPPTWAIRR